MKQLMVVMTLFVAARVSGAPLTIPGRGAHATGFRVFEQYDRSRVYHAKANYFGTPERGELSRPLQIAVWYPAIQGPVGTQMMYRNYIDLELTRDRFVKPRKAEIDANRKKWIEAFRERGLSPDEATALIESRVTAFRNAKAAPGAFPVIVYAPGADAASFDSSALFESLASHGYVVISSHSLGPHSPLMLVDADGLETQIRDIEYLIGFADQLPFANTRKLGLIGESWGGLAIVIEQMRNPNVDAVVSLDGSIKSFYALAKKIRNFDPLSVRSPFLLISANAPQGEMLYFNDLTYAPAYVAGFSRLEHQDVNSYAYLVIAAKAAEARTDEDREKMGEYETACQTALALVDAYVKQKSDGVSSFRAFLSDPKRGLRLAKWNEPRASPPTKEQFISLLRAQGVGAAEEVFHKFQVSDPDYLLFDEETLNNIGFEYFNGYHRNEEGIRIMKIKLEAFPRSFKAHGFLARLYEKNGDKSEALALYRQAVQLGKSDPQAEKGWLDYFRQGAERLSN